MKICPVCNDSFADQLNFCDIDGTRLTREGSIQERNKWWSLIGAALLVGAVVITAASLFFLPKARLSSPIVTSDSPSVAPPPSTAPAASPTAVAAAPAASTEPESVPTDTIIPEVRKKDKAPSAESVSGVAPNPKAAALAAEGADKKTAPIEVKQPAPPVPNKTEASSSAGGGDDARSDGAAAKPKPPPDLKKDTKTPPTVSKTSDKDSDDKKKNDEKEKKKGGFLRVFKKIFGKG